MADEKKKDDAPELIWVKTGRSDDRVALYELDPNHPEDAMGNKEIYVAGRDSRPVLAAKTADVQRKLREGELAESSEEEAADWDDEKHERRVMAIQQLQSSGQVVPMTTAEADSYHARSMGTMAVRGRGRNSDSEPEPAKPTTTQAPAPPK